MILYFDHFSKLPTRRNSTSREVAKFAAHFVDLNGPKSFKWPKFMDSLTAYPDVDLTLSKYQDTTLGPEEITLREVAHQSVQSLQASSSTVLTREDIEAISKVVEGAFTDLKTTKDKGNADFSQSSSGVTSTWEYRIELSFPNPDLDEFFYSILATIKLEANIREESEWYRMTSSEKKVFRIEMDGMELMVMDGFKDPKEGC
ncbi:delta-endotoxin CytB [Marasmius fiardii PR-910]|nr:delta-endotoxin CytB [Marasmius fiardii PR-910]